MSRSVDETGPSQGAQRCELRATAASIQLASSPIIPENVIALRPRCRLKPPLDHNAGLLTIEAGVAALETAPAGGRRQILDFLLPGEGVPAAIVRNGSAYFLRAITDTSISFGELEENGGQQHFTALLAQFKLHTDRCNLHRIVIGQLDTEARVATFLLGLAMRAGGALRTNTALELPMSRDDIADHLCINPDTLSRIMMRLESAGVIRRINRHSIVLCSPEELGRHTPLKMQSLMAASGRSTTGNSAAVPGAADRRDADTPDLMRRAGDRGGRAGLQTNHQDMLNSPGDPESPSDAEQNSIHEFRGIALRRV